MEEPSSSPRALCDFCGGAMEPGDENPVIYDCFHAACANGGSDAGCPRCRTPEQPEVDDDVDVRGNGDDPPSDVTMCHVCGDWFRPSLTSDCPYCSLQPRSPWSSLGSPSPQQPGALRGQSQQPPPVAPHTFASPPQPYQTGQFGYPAPSPFPQPLFESPCCYYYYYNFFPPVGPAPPPHHPFQTSTFQYHQQQQQQPTPAPPFFAYAPPTAAAAAAAPSCMSCGGAVVCGQTAVTSQCGHTFHFCCFARSVYTCPACGAQWRDVAPYRY